MFLNSYTVRRPEPAGSVLHTVNVHGVNAGPVAIHPSGEYCAYGAGSHLVLWAWAADRRRPLHTGGSSAVTSVAFTPDGVYALAGTAAPASISVFDIAAGTACFHATASHRYADSACITHLACSGDSRLLAAVETAEGRFAQLHVWDWSRGFASVATVSLESASPTGLLWMPPAGRVVTVCREEIVLWSLYGHTLEKIARRSSDTSLYADFAAAACAPTSALLYAVCASGKLVVLDSALQLLATVDVPGAALSVAVLGSAAVVGDAQGALHVYEAASLAHRQSLPFQDQVRGIVTAGRPPDLPYTAPLLQLAGARNVVLALSADALLLALDLTALRVSAFSLGHFGGVRSVCFDPSSAHSLASSADDQCVCVWTRLGGRTAITFLDVPRLVDPRLSALHRTQWSRQPDRGAELPLCVAYHPAGRLMAVGCVSGMVRLLDPHTGTQQAVLDTGSAAAQCVAFSPDGRYIGCARSDGSVTVFDCTADFTPLNVTEGGLPVLRFLGSRATALADVRDDSVLVAVAPAPDQLTIHQLTQSGTSYTNAVTASFSLSAPLRALCVHPSGEYLLAAAADSLLHVLHVLSGASRGAFPVGGVVVDMQCDPSGLYVAVSVVADAQRTAARVDLYEVGTGAYAGGTPCSPVGCVAFAPDASAVAGASDDGSVTVWRLDGAVQRNVSSVQAAMASEPQFWTRYPIYLPQAAPTQPPPELDYFVPPMAAGPSARPYASPVRSPSRSGAASALPPSALSPVPPMPGFAPRPGPRSPAAVPFPPAALEAGTAPSYAPPPPPPPPLYAPPAARPLAPFFPAAPARAVPMGAAVSPREPAVPTAYGGAGGHYAAPLAAAAAAAAPSAVPAPPPPPPPRRFAPSAAPPPDRVDAGTEPAAPAPLAPEEPGAAAGAPSLDATPRSSPLAGHGPVAAAALTPPLSDRDVHRLALLKASERRETLDELDRFEERVFGPRKSKKATAAAAAAAAASPTAPSDVAGGAGADGAAAAAAPTEGAAEASPAAADGPGTADASSGADAGTGAPAADAPPPADAAGEAAPVTDAPAADAPAIGADDTVSPALAEPAASADAGGGDASGDGGAGGTGDA